MLHDLIMFVLLIVIILCYYFLLSRSSHEENDSPFQALKHNGSLYAHVFFARSGYPPDPNDPEYQPLAAFGKTHRKIARLLLSDSLYFIGWMIMWWVAFCNWASISVVIYFNF